MGHIGMRYSLPSRELIADSAETVINAHWFDGVFISRIATRSPWHDFSSDADERTGDLCSGGPMKAGIDPRGHQITLSSMFEAVGTYKTGNMTKEDFEFMEQNACPTCSSCAGMFANSMNCLLEILGLAMPGNGTILAVSEERRELVRQAAFKLMDLVEKQVKPRDIVRSY